MKTFKYSLLTAAIAASGLYASAAAAADNINWSGFLNAVANFSDNEATYLEQINNDGYFGNTSLGLNATAKIDSNLTVAAQIFGGGHGGNIIHFDWGFASYRLGDSTVLKFGKIKYAGNLYSETVDVGFTYPWIRPPTAIYSEPTALNFEAYKGAAVRYTPDAAKAISIELFHGSAEGNPEELLPNHVKMTGLVVSAENDMGKLQAAYTASTMDLLVDDGSGDLIPGDTHGETYTVMSIGGNANYNNIGVIAEYSISDTDRTGLETVTNTGAYLTLSYKMGAYMPHVTMQSFESDDGLSAVNTVENNSVSVGVNKQLSPSSIFKIEIEKFDTKNGGFFEVVDSTQPDYNDENVTMFNVALNYVF